MNQKELNEMINSFKKNLERIKTLKKGDLIYELDSVDITGWSYFEHEVVSVDLDEMCVYTKDLSLKGKKSKLYIFSKKEELN